MVRDLLLLLQIEEERGDQGGIGRKEGKKSSPKIVSLLLALLSFLFCPSSGCETAREERDVEVRANL